MKKTIMSLALICLVSSVGFAQFEQGTMLTGGSVGFDLITNKVKSGSASVTFGKYTNLSLAPQFGYFIINNLAVGATVDVSVNKFKADGFNYTSTGTQLSFGPFARYYYQNIFGEATFNVGSSKDKEDDDGTVTETDNGLMGWSIAAGYAAFLNDNVAIEPKVGFGSTTMSDDSDVKDVYAGPFFRLGIQVYLRAK